MAIPGLRNFYQQKKASASSVSVVAAPKQPDIKVVSAQPNATIVPPNFVGPLRPTGVPNDPMPKVKQPQADSLGLQNALPAGIYNPAAPASSLKEFAGTKLGPVMWGRVSSAHERPNNLL